jgi:hypothetical protein
MKLSVPILFFSSLLASVGPLLASPHDDDLKPYIGKIISKIDIVRKNVFDDQMLSDPHFYFRWGNSLHIVTRESVIRRELLFDIGDTLDPQLIIETERNMRGAGFIGEVEIAALPDGADAVELTITTTDLWTTKPEIYLDLAGGNYTTGLAFTEGNLLGLGKYVQFLAQAGNDQDGYATFYIDNRLLGTRVAFDFTISDFTYSRGFSFNFTRPQYSLTIPYGLSLGVSNFRTKPRLFYQGDEYFRHRQNMTLGAFEGVYSLGYDRRLNLFAEYDYEKYDFSIELPGHSLNDIIPADETISYPSLGSSLSMIRYDVERFLDASGTPEDLTLGGSLKFKFGRSDDIFGADYTGNFHSVFLRFLARPAKNLFIGARDGISWWRNERRNERIRHKNEFALYYKPFEMHLLAIHGLTDFAWRQRSTYQVVLGGGSGLRGYSYYEFAGDKLAVGTIEYRFYSPITILTVRLGAAAFLDIGNVWRRNQRVDPGDFSSGAGVGLRFGLTKSSTSRVISLDFSRALSKDDYFIGFGTTTSFNLRNFSQDD